MNKKEYYVDSCIWLNLFKKEGDPAKGIPYWKLAQDFVKQVEEKGDTIFVSTIVFKELTFKLDEKLGEVKKYFEESEFITTIKTTVEDYSRARRWEQEHKRLSFYDYLHIAISQRLNIILITRDRELIEFAQKHITVFKPEELLS